MRIRPALLTVLLAVPAAAFAHVGADAGAHRLAVRIREFAGDDRPPTLRLQPPGQGPGHVAAGHHHDGAVVLAHRLLRVCDLL